MHSNREDLSLHIIILETKVIGQSRLQIFPGLLTMNEDNNLGS